MAENKEYITQVQDNGSVMISEDVIATIALHTLGEVEGFAGLASKAGADIMDILNKKNWGKSVKVTISADDELSVECNVLVHYGYSVVAVAKQIQQNVCAALESTAGVKVLAVNVNVCGIVRK